MSTALQVIKRRTGKRSELTKIRKEGKLPAIVYGFNIDSTPIAVDYKKLVKEVQKSGRNSVFKLDIEGTQVSALITEVQRCPLKGNVKHIDFLSINMAEEIEMDIPITVVGESIGINEGGVLTQPVRDLKIKVKPSEIPETIELDVSELTIGDSLSVADVRHKIDFEILNDDEDTLVTITPPFVADDDTAGQAVDENVNAIEAPESKA